MQYRAEGIVIRSMDYGEGNKIVTIVTDSFGKTGLMVRGAKKARSRHGSLAQPFTLGEFHYFRNTGLGTLSHGEIIESHHVLREQLELAAYAAYAAELTDKALQDEEAGRYIFEQLKACFASLEEGKDPVIVTGIYEMKILQAAGYGPALGECASCGNAAGPMALSPRTGGLLCGRCRSRDPYALVLGDGALKLLRLFAGMDLGRLGNVQVKDETRLQLKQAMRLLMDAHLGIPLKSRSFLDQMDKFSI
ncbi:DNA repair protein RecO [Paenibacillus humicola]|uniref:DNA repair protein RecO n=1 Tax=Paenibacillus humicola TaxID=3110540 RepID=UPI00237C08EF|nr:DNA repair protein RecO [Paenibacillus humicola]